MENEPLVTIAIPNYNYAHYLENCLNSLLNQTYSNFEVYFRDNQSTDDSLKIALGYKDKFVARGIYFNVSDNKRNLGSDINSELARRDAEGEYIYTLASDDAVKPEFLEKTMKVFEDHPEVYTVITNREEIDENGKIYHTTPFYNRNCIIDGESQAAVYMMAGIAIPAQRITRTSNKLRQYGGRKWNVAGDWYINFLYSMVGDVAYIKESLVQYRVHTGNETNESEKNLMGVFEHYQLINAFVDISKAFGMTKPAARYDEAVEKLGSMCLRYALKMLKLSLNDVACRYLQLAPVFKKDIIDDVRYIELSRITKILGSELEYAINEFENIYNLNRTVSYDPPDGFKQLYLE